MTLILVTTDEEVRLAFESILTANSPRRILAFTEPDAALLAIQRLDREVTHIVVDLDIPEPSALAICYSAVRVASRIDVELITIEASLRSDGTRGTLDAPWTISRSNVRESIAKHFLASSHAKTINPSYEDLSHLKPGNSANLKRLEIGDRISLPTSHQFLPRNAFDTYFASMSRSKLFETRVLTLKILNIDLVFEKNSPATFRKLLGDVCQALSSFFDSSSFRCTYNGHGVFFCAVSTSVPFNDELLLMSLKSGDINIGTSAKLSLKKLEFAVSQTKRAAGVFRCDDEFVPTNKGTARPRVHSRPIKTGEFRPRRIQTRLLSL